MQYASDPQVTQMTLSIYFQYYYSEKEYTVESLLINLRWPKQFCLIVTHAVLYM